MKIGVRSVGDMPIPGNLRPKWCCSKVRQWLSNDAYVNKDTTCTCNNLQEQGSLELAQIGCKSSCKSQTIDACFTSAVAISRDQCGQCHVTRAHFTLYKSEQHQAEQTFLEDNYITLMPLTDHAIYLFLFKV